MSARKAHLEPVMDHIELFTAELCPFAMRVRLALAEKDVPAREIEIDPRNKPDWFLKIAPHGQVPLLRHDGKLVWESPVICEYLDEAFPMRRLLPQACYERAEARMWIAFADARLYASTRRLLYSTDPVLRASILAELADALRVLESRTPAFCKERPYLLGAKVTLADLALYPWFEQAAVLERYFGFQISEYRGLAVWQEAIALRDSAKAIGKPPGFYLEAYGRLFAARAAVTA
jgi:glutathione S-transferase